MIFFFRRKSNFYRLFFLAFGGCKIWNIAKDPSFFFNPVVCGWWSEEYNLANVGSVTDEFAWKFLYLAYSFSFLWICVCIWLFWLIICFDFIFQEWERPKPGRRPDIFPQFSPMKTPLPPPLPCDPPEEDEEEEEKKEEEEENPEKEEPEQPEKQ